MLLQTLILGFYNRYCMFQSKEATWRKLTNYDPSKATQSIAAGPTLLPQTSSRSQTRHVTIMMIPGPRHIRLVEHQSPPGTSPALDNYLHIFNGHRPYRNRTEQSHSRTVQSNAISSSLLAFYPFFLLHAPKEVHIKLTIFAAGF